MIFKIISVIALIISLWSAWSTHQNTESIGHINNSLGYIADIVRDLSNKYYKDS